MWRRPQHTNRNTEKTMTNLTQNTPREFSGSYGPKIAWPVDANLQVFAGAALMKSASNGCAASVTPTANGEFLGFSVEHKDNRTGSPFGGTAASTNVEIEQSGIVRLTVARASSTFARTDSGTTVYASDNDTFTTDAGTNNIPIGKIHKVDEATIGAASGTMLVAFQATALRSL